MIFKKYFHDIVIGFEAIIDNKLKSILTALGIIFGVAAVISMMAIGNGAEQEILEQIKMVGVNNIIITPTEVSDSDASSGTDEEKAATKKFSKGLTMMDLEAIQEIVPTIKMISPVISYSYSAIIDGKSKPVVLEGVNTSYFEVFNIGLQEGELFNRVQSESGQPVCIIGDNIKTVFFHQETQLGNKLNAARFG